MLKNFQKLLKKNQRLINSLLAKEYKLENINNAIRDFMEGKVFRPIIKMMHE